jgi:hypothetical protein
LRPADFLQLIDAWGELSRLTDAIMVSAFKQAVGWKKAGRRIPVSINLSRSVLSKPCQAKLLAPGWMPGPDGVTTDSAGPLKRVRFNPDINTLAPARLSRHFRAEHRAERRSACRLPGRMPAKHTGARRLFADSRDASPRHI